MRAATPCALAALASLASCRDPTEVTLVLTTDVPCATLQMNGTSITVGTAGDLETKDPVTITSLCDESTGSVHDIGTLIVVPSSANDATFAVRIVSGVDTPVGDCVSPAYTGCIVERRELAFVPHTPLTLPIPMDLDCLNVSCQEHQTCRQGGCVSAVVPDPGMTCTTGMGCGADHLPLLEGGSQSPSDGSADTSQDEGPGTDGTLADVTVADMTAPDAGQSDGSGQPDGTPPGDGSPLGSCVSAATSSLSCSGAPCPGGEVCCVGNPPGGPVTEACSAPGACNYDVDGSTSSSLICRNVGECPVGDVCCLKPALMGFGYISTCVAQGSCPPSFVEAIACRHSCECGATTCKAVTPVLCGGLTIATCGGVCP
jgi:hypothetical protein